MCSIHWQGYLQILELTQGRDNTDAQILKMAKYQRISGLGLPRTFGLKIWELGSIQSSNDLRTEELLELQSSI